MGLGLEAAQADSEIVTAALHCLRVSLRLFSSQCGVEEMSTGLWSELLESATYSRGLSCPICTTGIMKGLQ